MGQGRRERAGRRGHAEPDTEGDAGLRFAHLSDTHLGFSQFGTGERADDIYKAFSQAIDESVKRRVDFAVFAGDVFHTPTPDGTAIMHMAHELKRLKEERIPAFFILGEHDISHAMLHPVPFVYHKLGYAVHVGDRPAYCGDAMIAGVDKMRRGDLEGRRDYLAKLDGLAAKHGGPKILLVHQGIAEAHRFASEIAASDLPRNFDYYAMGHIHERSVWNFDFLGGPLAYPGSIEVIGSEGVKDTKKGFYIVDMGDGPAVPEWVQLDTRPHRVVYADADSLEGRMDKLVRECGDLAKKPIVEVRTRGTVRPEKVRAQLARLEGSSFHASWKVQREERSPDALPSRPADTESEMLRLASESLGSERLARLAVGELLGPLADGDLREAERIISAEYERYGGGGP